MGTGLLLRGTGLLLRYSGTNEVTFLGNGVTDRYFLFTGNGLSNGSYFFGNKTIVAFSFVVLFKRGRSLVIALSPSIVRWPLKKSDCPLVAPRVFCDVDGGNHIQTGFS